MVSSVETFIYMFSLNNYMRFKETWENSKEVLKLIISPVIFILLLVLITSFLAKRTFLSYVFVIVFLQMFFDFLPTLKQNAKKYLKTLVVVGCFFVAFKFLGAYGIIGAGLSILLIAGYKIFMGWKIFTGAIDSIEGIISKKEQDEVEQCKQKRKGFTKTHEAKEVSSTYEEIGS